MAKKLLAERYTVSAGDIRRHTIRYTSVLDRGEKLTGTPQFDDASGDLAFTAPAFNAVVIDVLSQRAGVGEALSFTLSGQEAGGGPYRFGVSVETTFGQTIGCDIMMEVA